MLIMMWICTKIRIVGSDYGKMFDELRTALAPIAAAILPAATADGR